MTTKRHSSHEPSNDFTTNKHFAIPVIYTHAIFAQRPQAENTSHYVLWLHDVDKNIEEN